MPPGRPLANIHIPPVTTPTAPSGHRRSAHADTAPTAPPAAAATPAPAGARAGGAGRGNGTAQPDSGQASRRGQTPPATNGAREGRAARAPPHPRGQLEAGQAQDTPRPSSTSPTARRPPTNPTFMDALPGPAPVTGVPNFVIQQFRVPPFLLPIYQAAGIQYGIRWEVLAAINEIETDYGRNLNVSSAGAVGLDAVHALDLGDLRRRRQQRRPQGPLQPGRRDLRRRALPQGRRRRQGHATARSSPTTTPAGTSTP